MKPIKKLYIPAIFIAGLSLSQSVKAMELEVKMSFDQNQKELVLHSLINQLSTISGAMLNRSLITKADDLNPLGLAFSTIKARLVGEDYLKLALSFTGSKLNGMDLLNLAYVCRTTYLPCLLAKNAEFPDFSVKYNTQASLIKEKSDGNRMRLSFQGFFDDVDPVTEELLFNRSMSYSTEISDSEYETMDRSTAQEDPDLSEEESFAEIEICSQVYDRKNPCQFSPNSYVIKQTWEVNEENLVRNYKQWHDIPNFTPQRTFWMNDNFIELLGLLINLKSGRGNDQDRKRCEIIFNRFRKSALPKNSVLMEYVDYLSIDPLRRLSYFTRFDLPKLKSYTEKEGFDNEKAVYLYHTYLDGKKTDINALEQDPLFYKVEGGIGAFIRSQRILHPIRLKMKNDQEHFSKIHFLQPQLTMEDIEALVALDYGITRKDMEFILETLINDSENPKFSRLIKNGLEKLAKYANKHVPEKHYYGPSRDVIDFFRQKAEKKVFTRFLHFSLKAKAAAGKIINESTYLEACNLLKEVGYHEMSYFHVDQIQKIHERNWLRRQAEREAARAAATAAKSFSQNCERTIWRGL